MDKQPIKTSLVYNIKPIILGSEDARIFWFDIVSLKA